MQILVSIVILLQLIVAEHSQAGEGRIVGLVLQTLLTGSNGILEVTAEVAGTGELVQIVGIDLADRNLLELVVGRLTVVSQHEDMTLDGVDADVRTCSLQLVELGSSSLGVDLTVDKRILVVRLHNCGVYGNSLFIEGCSLTAVVA